MALSTIQALLKFKRPCTTLFFHQSASWTAGRRTACCSNSSTPQSSSSSGSSSTSTNGSTTSYTIHSSLDESIIDQYDAFILDQFGVLHNGQNALDGAVQLVEYLAFEKKKKLIILSNTSAPAEKALAKLPTFGFDVTHFQGGAVTSGEEASRYIRMEFGQHEQTNKALMLTWDASQGSTNNNPRLTALPESFLEQCGNIQLATTIEEADFVLFHGSEVWYKGPQIESVSLSPFIEDGDLTNVDTLLQVCVERDLPAICANPDFVVQTPDGNGVNYMPGKLAARYLELGGQCRTFGKPDVEHFEACIKKLGLSFNKKKVAHVGDSLHHDIAGACRAGIPCVFVTSGIHKSDLGTEFGELPGLDTLEQLLAKECEDDIRPTHVVAAFRL